MKTFAYLSYIFWKIFNLDKSYHILYGNQGRQFGCLTVLFYDINPLRIGKAETKSSLAETYIEDIYVFRQGISLQFQFLTKENT